MKTVTWSSELQLAVRNLKKQTGKEVNRSMSQQERHSLQQTFEKTSRGHTAAADGNWY